MEQRTLKLYTENKTFFEKVTNTLTKILIPTRVGINGMMITIKRSNLLKAYDNYKTEGESKEKLNRYEEAFTLYLESIDKHIMDSIYKKVKNGTASDFEKNALSQYYNVTRLKETNYSEYKYRKQKYLLELDYETLIASGKEKTVHKYNPFYVEKMDSLYKGILKTYSIKLTDTVSAKKHENIDMYNNIFETIEEYVINILPLKIETDKTEMNKIWNEENEKFARFNAGKFDEADILEKKLVLLGISRSLFTHSLPLVAAEECYVSLIKDTRDLIVKTKNDRKKQEAFKLLMQVIEEYNTKLLSTKVYWEKTEEREAYKKFWEKYKNVNTNKEKEILFMQYDLKMLNKSKKTSYDKIKAFYKEMLTQYGVMKKCKNECKTLSGTWIKKNFKREKETC